MKLLLHNKFFIYTNKKTPFLLSHFISFCCVHSTLKAIPFAVVDQSKSIVYQSESTVNSHNQRKKEKLFDIKAKDLIYLCLHLK